MQRENSEANTASTIIDKKTPTQFSLHNALILSSSIVREMKCVCVLLSLHLWFLPVSQWNIKTRSLWLGIGEYNHTRATFPDQTAKTKLLLFFLHCWIKLLCCQQENKEQERLMLINNSDQQFVGFILICNCYTINDFSRCVGNLIRLWYAQLILFQECIRLIENVRSQHSTCG